MSEFVHLKPQDPLVRAHLHVSAERIIEGVSPTVEFHEVENGTEMVVTDINGEHSTVIENGYTPQKGVDYWTPEDEAEIQNAVDAANTAATAADNAATSATNAASAADEAAAAAREAASEVADTNEIINAQHFQRKGNDIGWLPNRISANDIVNTSLTPSESHTDYIPIFGGQRLYFKTHLGRYAYCFIYDANKVFLQRYGLPQDKTTADAYEEDIVVQQNAAFIRLSCSNAYLEDTEIFIGGAAEAIQYAVSHIDDSEYVPLDFTLTGNKRISGLNGSELDSSMFYMYASSMVDVSDVTKLIVVTAFNNDEAGYAFYSDGVFVSGVQGTEIEYSQYKKTYSIIVPDNANGFRFTCYAAADSGGQTNYMSVSDCVVFAVPRNADIRRVENLLKPDITSNKERISKAEVKLSKLENNIPFMLQANTFISSVYNGVRTSQSTVTIAGPIFPEGNIYSKYWWSDWLDIRGFDHLYLRTVLGSGAGYAFRKGNEIYRIYGASESEANVLTDYWIDVPWDAEYFAFSAVLYNQTEEVAYDIDDGAPYSTVKFLAFADGSFVNEHAEGILRATQNVYPPYEGLLPEKKILCFGDSLTVGALPSGSGYSGATTPYCEWLTALGAFPGEIEKIAKSGYSASDWYADSDYANIDFSQYGTVLLWLGTNHGPTTMPTWELKDETPGTETYYYRKIIEDIISANENVKIIFGTVFASKDNVNTVNNTIHEIAHVYSTNENYSKNILGVTEFNDGTLFGPEEKQLHNNSTTNPHFTPGGYLVLAAKWLGEIRRLIYKNIGMFTSKPEPRSSAVSPTVETESITGGTKVIITDINGDHPFNVMNGLQGSPGPQGAPGNPPTITVSKSGTTTEINFSTELGTETAYIEDGAAGTAGKDGVDGVSPTATVSKSGSIATISITDKNGTTTAQISDGVAGSPGEKGDPGSAGADGFSPVASVSKTGTTATITITDKNGTTTATISDGAKGDPGDDYVLTQADKQEIAQMNIDDTAGAGDTDVTWSANKITSELANAGTIQDVRVNNTSVVTSGIANITMPDTGLSVVNGMLCVTYEGVSS